MARSSTSAGLARIIDDFTAVMSAILGVPRAADPPLGSHVPNQLFFQHSAGVNEQAAMDGLVRYAHRLILGKLVLQHLEICSGDHSKVR